MSSKEERKRKRTKRSINTIFVCQYNMKKEKKLLMRDGVQCCQDGIKAEVGREWKDEVEQRNGSERTEKNLCLKAQGVV
jgi:hypothetical protein